MNPCPVRRSKCSPARTRQRTRCYARWPTLTTTRSSRPCHLQTTVTACLRTGALWAAIRDDGGRTNLHRSMSKSRDVIDQCSGSQTPLQNSLHADQCPGRAGAGHCVPNSSRYCARPLRTCPPRKTLSGMSSRISIGVSPVPPESPRHLMTPGDPEFPLEKSSTSGPFASYATNRTACIQRPPTASAQVTSHRRVSTAFPCPSCDNPQSVKSASLLLRNGA